MLCGEWNKPHSEEVTRGGTLLAHHLSLRPSRPWAKPIWRYAVARYLRAVLMGTGAPKPVSDPPVDLLRPLHQHEMPDALDELGL
jgi:hypothetical protein